jgi:hypothetical protein
MVLFLFYRNPFSRHFLWPSAFGLKFSCFAHFRGSRTLNHKNFPDEGGCYEKTINDIEMILFDLRNERSHYGLIFVLYKSIKSRFFGGHLVVSKKSPKLTP